MREFRATGRYLQGPGAISALPGLLAELADGERAAVIVDRDVLALLGDRLTGGLGAGVPVLPFSGEITAQGVATLAEGVPAGTGAIAAVGGGKALDAGKAVALLRGARALCVPTIASTDAPASRGIAIYDAAHRLVEVRQMPWNPWVLVDTAVIAAAPAKFLRAGIGDALAKKFEGEAALAGGGINKHGTRPLLTGLIVADGCYRTLRDHGAAAVAAAERGVADAALEAVVEAAFLMSAIGFENTGLSLAHSLTRGLVKTPVVADVPHGFHVAYGTLFQLAAEGRPQEALRDLADFLRQTGLPRKLADMGGTADNATLDRIVDLTMTSPHIGNCARPLAAADLRAALDRVEGLN